VPSPGPVNETPVSLHTIDWGGITSFGLPDPHGLVGVEDAFDHTPLLPGERVAFCTRDKVAYHIETWEFLRAQNRGRCCICGQTSVIQLVTLPGTPLLRPEAVIPQPLGTLLPGEKIISLKEVTEYLNLAVTVEDYVYEVYQTKSTGSYFVRFEPRSPYQPVFSGFKVVIFKNYLKRWTAAGLAVEDYRHRSIRVRGVVQEHPRWGIEILVNSPRMIEIVSGADQKPL
jgi:hypothetical protein